MAKISLNLDERTIKNGMAQIRLRINHRKTSAFVGTGVYVEPSYFIPGTLYDPIHRKASLFVEKRDKVQRIVRSIEEWLLDQDEDTLAHISAKDIKEQACGVCTHTHEAEVVVSKIETTMRKANDMTDFVVFFGEYGDSRTTDKTRKSYEYVWNILREYCTARGLQTLRFSDIDYARLTDLARWIKASGRGESTRHMIESYVRAAYKDAQKRKLVDRSNDPYFDYSIAKVPAKDIDCLTAHEMRKVMDGDLSQFAGLQRARDYALLSFYLCGANLLDIYEMASSKDEVVFTRHKVQRASLRPIHIRIEPELAALLEVYGGKERLLSEAERVPNYETFQRRVNHLLKQAGKKIGVDVTLAKVRRSWATIAASLDVPDRVIDKSMGHVDASVKDRHYEQYDWSRTAEANRKIIDYIKSL